MAEPDRGAVLEAIVDVIAPYLGQGMARSAVMVHAQKLGLEGVHLTPDQIAMLMAKIGAGLNIFVGREKSAVILAEVRQVLAGMVRA